MWSGAEERDRHRGAFTSELDLIDPAIAAHQRIEMQQPFLAEQPDIQIDAIQRAQRAHGIGAVFQHARRVDSVGLHEELRQRRIGGHKIVELLVIQIAAGERLLARSAWPAAAAARDCRRRSSCADC